MAFDKFLDDNRIFLFGLSRTNNVLLFNKSKLFNVLEYSFVEGFSKLKSFMNSYLLDVRNSHDYRKLHLIKSRWTTRANIRFLKFKTQKDVLLIYDEPIKAQLAAKTIKKTIELNLFLTLINFF